jgi:type I restriction enzyme S subunit
VYPSGLSFKQAFCTTIPLSAEYLFCQFSDANFATLYGGLTTGTSNSHQRVKVDYLMEQILVQPNGRVVEAFTAVVRPLFEKVKASIRAQETLADLRDTLLPRLISGKLRVPDAETLVEAAL